MAEIIYEIVECCVKFDQHRPHFKVLLNQYASILFWYCRLLLLVKSKHNILLLRNSYLFKIPNSQLFSYTRKGHTERIEVAPSFSALFVSMKKVANSVF